MAVARQNAPAGLGFAPSCSLKFPDPSINQSDVWRSRNPPALFLMLGSSSFVEVPYYRWRISIEAVSL